MMIGLNALIGTVSSASSGSSVIGISVFNSNTDVELFSSNDLVEVLDWLNGHTFDHDTLVQFNSSAIYLLDDTIELTFDTDGNEFIIQSADGFTATLDGQDALGTLVESALSNFIFRNINVRNCDVTNVAGCIIRQQSDTSNILYENIRFSRGYCAMRSTGVQEDGMAVTIVSNMNIENCIVEDTVNGSFRFGNGLTDPDPYKEDHENRPDEWYDMQNITIKNITLIDNFNKGNITGTTSHFHGLLIQKKIKNLIIENVQCNNDNDTLIFLEGCSYVTTNRITCEAFGTNGLENVTGFFATYCYMLKVYNTILRGNVEDEVSKTVYSIDNTADIWFYHNSSLEDNYAPVQMIKCKRIRIAGNVIRTDFAHTPMSITITEENGYVPSVEDDLVEDDFNVFCSGGDYVSNFIFKSDSYPHAVNIEVQNASVGGKLTPTEYRTTYDKGVNNIYDTEDDVISATRVDPDTNVSPQFYLTDGSDGRNMLSSAIHVDIDELVLDARGYERVYPCDAGAVDKDATILN